MGARNDGGQHKTTPAAGAVAGSRRAVPGLVEGDYAHIVWTAETANTVYDLGTDSFVVRDGKIVAHFFSGKITRKE